MSRSLLASHVAPAPDRADLEAASGICVPLAHAAEEPSVHRFEIRCRVCGFGGVVARLPQRCPLCSGDVWEPVAGAPCRRGRVRAPMANEPDAA